VGRKRKTPGPRVPKPKVISKSTTTDGLSVNILENILLKSKVMHPRIKWDDKTTNQDGYVDVKNEKLEPIGELTVQVKTLGAGKKQHSCESTLVERAEQMANPFLLICVDQENEVAYWKQLSKDMPEYKADQDSFTIKFTKADLIDKSFSFCKFWTKLAVERARLPNDYKSLRSELLHEVDPALLADLQEFIGVINAEFDTHWSHIKKRLFPGLWQFGVLLVHHDEKNGFWTLQIYSISKGTNAPAVMAGPEIPLEPGVDPWGRIPFGIQFLRTFNPVKDGMAFVKEIVEQVLATTTPFYSTAMDGIIHLRKPAFFVPRTEACLREQVFAVYRSFPDLKLAQKGEQLDLEALLKMLEELDVFSLNIPSFDVNDALDIHRTGLEACRALLSSTKMTTYPYLGESQPVLMHEGQEQSDITKNLRALLGKIVTEYQQFLKANGLQFLGDHWFDQSLMVFFVIKKCHNGTITYDEFFVDYPGDGARIRVVDSDEVDLSEYWATHTITIKNQKYQARFSKYRVAPMQLFTQTPLTELLSRMLNEDIQNYFKTNPLARK
jgi:hypothetical protein